MIINLLMEKLQSTKHSFFVDRAGLLVIIRNFKCPIIKSSPDDGSTGSVTGHLWSTICDTIIGQWSRMGYPLWYDPRTMALTQLKSAWSIPVD